MKVEESDLREESSSSLQSFYDASSLRYDNETPEALDDSGVHDVQVVTKSSTGDDVGSPTAKKDRSYYHLKPSARQFMGGDALAKTTLFLWFQDDVGRNQWSGKVLKFIPTHLPNTKMFLDHLRCAKPNNSHVMESFDVSSLYTNVSNDSAMEAIFELLTENEQK
ncbi:hypothetical protein KIN20_014254 [Parelaphostrongylus tenuis]|uniref:Reverse transcriptase domain-containing protein n=1 Tax=Parelaphostrongylus tenuis TaxID=148309 RepID=A0AAD5MI29_PARTN|nr:hypothetical protein KIN20_014254 [Parelaphostrongylus tenuis]